MNLITFEKYINGQRDVLTFTRHIIYRHIPSTPRRKSSNIMQVLKAFVAVLLAMTVTVFAAPLNPQPLPPGDLIDHECTLFIGSADEQNRLHEFGRWLIEDSGSSINQTVD
jgi:hypothetical protein